MMRYTQMTHTWAGAHAGRDDTGKCGYRSRCWRWKCRHTSGHWDAGRYATLISFCSVNKALLEEPQSLTAVTLVTLNIRYFPLLLLPQAIVSAMLKPSQWFSRKLQSSEAAHPLASPVCLLGKGVPGVLGLASRNMEGGKTRTQMQLVAALPFSSGRKARQIQRRHFLFTNFQSSREAVREDEGAWTSLLHRGGDVWPEQIPSGEQLSVGSSRLRGAHLPPNRQALVTPCHPRCTHTPSAQNTCHWGHSYCADIRAGACKFLISTSFLIPATTVPSRHTRHTQQTLHTHQVYTPDTHIGYTCNYT